jgi:tetratricopeptide (TPR) repeat protein
MTDETKGGGAASATGLPAAQQLENLRSAKPPSTEGSGEVPRDPSENVEPPGDASEDPEALGEVQQDSPESPGDASEDSDESSDVSEASEGLSEVYEGSDALSEVSEEELTLPLSAESAQPDPIDSLSPTETASAPDVPRQASFVSRNVVMSAATLDRDVAQASTVVDNCREIYAVAKTALEELGVLASRYLTFEQKKRVYAQAASFGQPLRPAAALPGMPQQAVGGGFTPTPGIIEEIERSILARVQHQIGADLAQLARRAGDTAAVAGTSSEVGEKLDSLAGALRSLERSLPTRIGEVVDSKLSHGTVQQSAPTGLLAAVEEVRSAVTGFSIDDLDLKAIASMTDRAGSNQLPPLGGQNNGVQDRQGAPSNSSYESSSSPGTLSPREENEPRVEVNRSEPTSRRDEEAPEERILLTPSSQPGPEVSQSTPRTAVVFLEDDEEELGLESLDLDTGEMPEVQLSSSLPMEQVDEGDFVPSEPSTGEEKSSLSSPSSEHSRSSFTELAEGNEDPEEPTVAVTSDELAKRDEAEPTADNVAEAEQTVPAAAEDVVLAPVVSEEDSIELDLGAVTGDVSPPESVSLSIGESEEEEEEATVVAPVPEASSGQVEATPSRSLGEMKDETEVELRLQHAAELRGRNRLSEALQQYDAVIEQSGPNYEAHIGRGVVFLQTRNYEEAAKEFSIAERIDSTRPAGALGLAEVSFHQKHFVEAIEHYSSCIRLDPRLAQAFRNRGLCYYHQQNFSSAESDLRKAYELDPALPNIKKYLKITRNKLRTSNGGSSSQPSA